MKENTKCGFWCFYPKWLQNWATSRTFIAVYGLLGTVQSMSFIYIVVSLTTLEKRFKIPSRTTGIIMSGNEISQILSVLLIYYGNAGHRPRWLAVGVFCSALSCLVLALPHFIYGPGQDALALTREYLNASLVSYPGKTTDLPVCSRASQPEACDEESLTDTSIVPRLLVFFSQFILGIGTTLYYGLGQTYMDDNTKKKNVPMLLGFTLALRMVGPTLGYVLSYLCLDLYIDPTLHPIIDQKDPRWLGAWWLGWIILGPAMFIFSGLLAMFPRELDKSKRPTIIKEEEEALNESKVPLRIEASKNECNGTTNLVEKPTLREFPKAVKRIMTNKILLCTLFSGLFYVLSASPYISFFAKYLEVQFQTTPGGGTIFVGPLTLLGMVLGYMVSGVLIGKFKPSPKYLLYWNVLVGVVYLLGQISFMFLSCSGSIEGVDMATMKMNLTSPCNAACSCETVKYAPVCHQPTKTTFFSACHAGCRTIVNDTTFADCGCVSGLQDVLGTPRTLDHVVTSGPCEHDCFKSYLLFAVIAMITDTLSCSGTIVSVLLSFRCVETRDKSLAQGMTLMMLSLFGLIPGPIIFGAIMDSTCLIWDMSCGKKGNCWFYHTDNFKYYVNIVSAGFCIIALMFDVTVCHLVKDIDFYGEEDENKKTPALKGSQLKLPNEEDIVRP
ncbi:solute carrier organic anion transporter family member 4C1 [Copidosoma floridanum]|uniref:solute carrier organic anion transporter family member 4C1 n=1 Tax=Copidosoma floridanum TaxID=29053 RepID=UPI0006C96C9D|nr:solute carrier organic anion transporter family member 4C1 [Copidosoma floridanum]XP_014214480.1 solute carrier organic anion transporter family member 4C1 [Copidosoma floridanum]